MWGGIELRELETIFALADELHFGRAAERLGVSTAHVSQTLRHVERRLGGQLFERTSRRVELTLLGDTLVRNLRPLVTELDRQLSEAAATAAGLTGPLRIAHIMTVEGVPRLAEACAEFERRMPGVKILRLRYDLFDYVSALRREDTDIWVSWWGGEVPERDEQEGLVSGPPIARQPTSLLVGRTHPLAGRESISLEDLVDHPLVDRPVGLTGLFWDCWFPMATPSGRPVPRVVDPSWTGYFHDLARVLDEGKLGWLTISNFLETVWMRRTLVSVPVRDARDLVLVPWWRADRESPAIRAFAEIVRGMP